MIIKDSKIDKEVYGFDVQHELDLQRLKKFVSFNIKFRKREAG